MIRILFFLEYIFIVLSTHPYKYEYELPKLRQEQKERLEKYRVNKQIRSETRRLSRNR